MGGERGVVMGGVMGGERGVVMGGVMGGERWGTDW